MANNLNVRIPWQANKGFTEEKWEAALRQVENFVNNVKLTSDNINAGEIGWDKFPSSIVDEEKLTLASGSLSIVSNSLDGSELGSMADPDKIQDKTVYPHMIASRAIANASTGETGSLIYQNYTTVGMELNAESPSNVLTTQVKITLTTSGRPVILAWVSNVTSAGQYGLKFVQSNSSLVYTEVWERTTNEVTDVLYHRAFSKSVPAGSIGVGDDVTFLYRPRPLQLDTPPAGTHTYEYKVLLNNSPTDSGSLLGARLYAWEI